MIHMCDLGLILLQSVTLGTLTSEGLCINHHLLQIEAFGERVKKWVKLKI